MWISKKNEQHSGAVSRPARHRSGTSGGVLRAMLLTLLVLCFGMMSARAEEYEIGVPVDDRVVDNLHVTDVYHLSLNQISSLRAQAGAVGLRRSTRGRQSRLDAVFPTEPDRTPLFRPIFSSEPAGTRIPAVELPRSGFERGIRWKKVGSSANFRV